MPKNVARYVLGALLADPDRPALVGFADLSRGDLLARVEGRTAELLELGIDPGEFVVVLCGRGERFREGGVVIGRVHLHAHTCS